jgi:hypothetical protein
MSSASGHRRIMLAIVAGVALFVGQGMALAGAASASSPAAAVGTATAPPPSPIPVWSWLANLWEQAECLAGWKDRCRGTVEQPRFNPKQDNGCSANPDGATCTSS